MMGKTASLVTDTQKISCDSSSGLMEREIIPMSTAPASVSVMPLPAPPPCTSNCTSGCSLLNSSAHTVIMGYKANAPETVIVPLMSPPPLEAGASAAVPHALSSIETLSMAEKMVRLVLRIFCLLIFVFMRIWPVTRWSFPGYFLYKKVYNTTRLLPREKRLLQQPSR